MSWFGWLYGGSKSAAAKRAENRRAPAGPDLRIFDPSRGRGGRDTEAQPQAAPAGSGTGGGSSGIETEQWYPMISSNVDRIRYHTPTKELEVVFKDGSCYRYEDVEPSVFMSFLSTHSPGQYVWYILRQYGYRYSKISAGNSVSAAAPPRFDEQPFAIPPEVQKVQEEAGRQPAEGGLWNFGTPKAQGVVPPHSAWTPGS